MSQVKSSQILAGSLNTTDGHLVIVPDPASPLKPGRYSFSLTVTDDLGLNSPAATTVVEVRSAPVVKLDAAPAVVAFDQNINLIGSATTTGSIKSYAWSVKLVG